MRDDTVAAVAATSPTSAGRTMVAGRRLGGGGGGRPCAFGLMLALVAGAAAGQDQPKPGAEQPADPGPRAVTLDELPTPMRLGARVATLKRAIPAASALVIVPDEASYAEAIARWTPKLRYPVLIDDGTPESADRIGMFVRGLAPARVLRWESAKKEFPTGVEERTSLVWRTIARAWGLSTDDTSAENVTAAAVVKRIRATGWTPPGVVVVDLADASWAAGVALAAGYGQPIVHVRYPFGPLGAVPEKNAAEINAAAASTAESLGLSYRALGDEIDAVTVCANIPTKVNTPAPTDFVALSDRIGRADDLSARWAWSGQIFAPSAARASYNAMCGLFLRPTTAWLFNGYEVSSPWNEYAQKPAAEAFTGSGLKAETIEFPSGTEKTWRTRATRPVDGSYVFVTTMGNADFFQLQGGQCRPGDVPVLSVPSATYFIHSWSMTAAASRDTVAGRWLERGAFAYMGSVQEPFLQAFLKPSMAANRLALGAPWSAALHADSGPMWRVGAIGDPLFTWTKAFGGTPEPVDSAPPLEDAKALTDAMREALREKDFAGAVRLLAMLGRDGDAAGLLAATMKDAPDKVTPELAAAGILPAFRAGDAASVRAAFDRLSPEGKTIGVFRDVLWMVGPARTNGRPDGTSLSVFKSALRPDQAARDAAELGTMWSQALGKNEAISMLEQLRAAEKDETVRAQIETAARALR